MRQGLKLMARQVGRTAQRRTHSKTLFASVVKRTEEPIRFPSSPLLNGTVVPAKGKKRPQLRGLCTMPCARMKHYPPPPHWLLFLRMGTGSRRDWGQRSESFTRSNRSLRVVGLVWTERQAGVWFTSQGRCSVAPMEAMVLLSLQLVLAVKV